MFHLYLCRHGQTVENQSRILQGQMHGHLNEDGKKQAVLMGESLRSINADIVISSDLQRCVDTAHLALGENIQLVLEPLLRERDWGPLTGKTIEEARQYPDIDNCGESISALYKRAEILLHKWESMFDGQTIIAFGHGMTNRVIQAAYHGVSVKEIDKMDNAEVRHIEIQTPIEFKYSVDSAEASAN
ncbi:MAG: histidine phosphatase family protein [Bacteroidales bacterium]|nr:histidine phosphatase family protein [Bacteroidales bacterium]